VKPLLVTTESTASRHTCECGRRIVAWQAKQRRYHAAAADHGLCLRCWQAEKDRTRATSKGAVKNHHAYSL
jgi:hypothetical protein